MKITVQMGHVISSKICRKGFHVNVSQMRLHYNLQDIKGAPLWDFRFYTWKQQLMNETTMTRAFFARYFVVSCCLILIFIAPMALQTIQVSPGKTVKPCLIKNDRGPKVRKMETLLGQNIQTHIKSNVFGQQKSFNLGPRFSDKCVARLRCRLRD